MRCITFSKATCILGAVLAASLSAICLGQDAGRPVFNPRIVLRRPMRPIVDAPVVAAKDATSEVVTDNELVLGVVVDGKPRAYPINMLTGPSREIVNDKLGGRSIAATW